MRGFRYGLAIAAVSLAAPAMAATSIVTNGGFETGSFTGWTLSGNTGFTGVTGVFSEVNPFEGTQQAYFGAIGSTGTLSQTLSTVANQVYSYSFSLYNFGGVPNSFSAQIGGNIVPPTIVNGGQQNYTTYNGTFTATGESTQLAFSFQQDPSYYLLDAVSVSAITAAVPEPATWAMMIGGFGIAGASLRRRRQKITVTYA